MHALGPVSDFKSDTWQFAVGIRCPTSVRHLAGRLRRMSTIARVHLRMPSIDRGVQSFVWAVVFFLFLYFGMVLIAVAKGTAFVVSAVVAFLVFLFVRTRGDDDPRDA